MKKFVCVAVASFLFSHVLPASAITFGEEVISASTDYPSVISIWHKESLSDTPRFICTGTAIQTKIVLTAAHCVLNKGFYYVKAGVDRLEDESKFISVPATWRNPKYSASQGVNDIGLLLLESELPTYAITKLPSARQVTSVQANKKTRYEIVGWGIDQNGDDATYLRRAAVDDQSSFMKRFKGWRNDVWVAVGKYNKKERVFAGACNGDSGGPLFAVLSGVRTLVGVTSWGAEDCETVSPSIYVRLSYYIDTIIQVGIPNLLTNSLRANRLPPGFVSKPEIVMQEQNGYLLTCNFEGTPGTSSTITWSSRAYTFTNVRSKSVLLEPGQSAAEVKCSVEVSNSNGTVVEDSVYQIPAAPTVSNYPELSRMPEALALDGTQQVSCTSASGAGFAQTLTSLWVGKSSSYDSSQVVKVADGNSVTLTKQFLEQNGGKYLYCVTTLTSKVSKKTVVSPSSLIPKIQLLQFDYSNISFTGSFTPGTYYAPANGETIGCVGRYSSNGEVIKTGFEVSFLVGSTNDPSLANMLTSQNPFTVTTDLRNAMRGKYLFCKFTYSNLAGASTGFTSAQIGKDLPPHSVAVDIQGVNSYTDLAVGTQVKCAYSPAKGTTVGSVSFMTTNGFTSTGDSFIVTQEILNKIIGQTLTCNVYGTNGENGGTFSSSVIVRGLKTYVPIKAMLSLVPRLAGQTKYWDARCVMSEGSISGAFSWTVGFASSTGSGTFTPQMSSYFSDYLILRLVPGQTEAVFYQVKSNSGNPKPENPYAMFFPAFCTLNVEEAPQRGSYVSPTVTTLP